MYSLFLVLGVALVILSPIALELYLTFLETRQKQRSRCGRGRQGVWTPFRLHS